MAILNKCFTNGGTEIYRQVLLFFKFKCGHLLKKMFNFTHLNILFQYSLIQPCSIFFFFSILAFRGLPAFTLIILHNRTSPERKDYI